MKRVIAILVALLMTTVMIAGSACSGILSPGFEVTDVSVSPEVADVGEEVTITVTIENQGDAAGITYVPLLINGQPGDVDQLELDAGESGTVTFTTVQNYGGTYEIDVLGQTATLTITPSAMQNILKMVPADWNAFAYFGAETMRDDDYDPVGMGDFYTLADDYLQTMSEAMNIDPEDDWPFSMDNLDYIALAVGGLEETNFDEPGSMPNMALMTSISDVSTSSIGSFLTNYHTNFADMFEGGSSPIQFVPDTHNDVSIWTVDVLEADPADPGSEDPGVSIAVIEGSTIIIIGPTEDVTDCIDVIQADGDDDSLFDDENVKNVVGDFGDPIMMAIMNGDVPIPSEDGGDGPDLPETLNGTIGFAMSKSDDTIRLEGILEIESVSDWLDIMLSAMPAAEDLFPDEE